MQSQKRENTATLPVTLHRWEDMTVLLKNILQLSSFKNEDNYYVAAVFLNNRYEVLTYKAFIVSELLHLNHYFRDMAAMAIESNAERVIFGYYNVLLNLNDETFTETEWKQEDWQKEFGGPLDALKRLFYPLRITVNGYVVYDKSFQCITIENAVPAVRF
jgi:hypothetical protein